MRRLHWLTGVVVAVLLWALPAQAQWQTPTFTVPIGRGAGVTGYNSAAPIVGGLLSSTSAAANPAFSATPTLGNPGSVVGTLSFGNLTSGTVKIQPVTGALGAVTLSLPARTDTLVTLAGTEALTNKTVNGNTITSGTGTLTFGAGKTLTASNTLTFTGTDGSSVALGAGGTVSYIIASGTSAMGTSAISSATCATVVTTTATGTATTDVVDASFNGDPTAVTGYVPLTSGMLTIVSYPTVNNVNFKVCNNTANSITPGAITLNWKVRR